MHAHKKIKFHRNEETKILIETKSDMYLEYMINWELKLLVVRIFTMEGRF